jgi:lipoprotein-releasing system ATP-binding protein
MNAVIEALGVKKVYVTGGGTTLEVLSHVDMAVQPGEVVAIVGTSGSGKSTLLHLLGALDDPTAGEIRADGESYAALSAGQRDRLRNEKLGFVFQFHHLLREFSALENVMMPLLIAGWTEARARSRAEEILAEVGLAGRMTHRPSALSGGEQQRCAVARAVVHDPRVLLADEPSGNLDNFNSERLHDLLFGMARALEIAMVLVTHNPALAQRSDRVLLLENGRLRKLDSAEVLP